MTSVPTINAIKTMINGSMLPEYSGSPSRLPHHNNQPVSQASLPGYRSLHRCPSYDKPSAEKCPLSVKGSERGIPFITFFLCFQKGIGIMNILHNARNNIQTVVVESPADRSYSSSWQNCAQAVFTVSCQKAASSS